jgi:cold shock CspA family protein
MQGKVKRFMIDRGYGFIESQWARVFFHVSEITPALRRGTDIAIGTKFDFDEVNGDDGRVSAQNIRILVDVGAQYR